MWTKCVHVCVCVCIMYVFVVALHHDRVVSCYLLTVETHLGCIDDL